MIIDVIIPAYNEEHSIAKVVKDIPDYVREVIVCNNNSKDNTEKAALNAGATVVLAPNPGYGNACLKGIQYVSNKSIQPDVIVFLDGDYSDYPKEMSLHIEKIKEGYELVIGSRLKGKKEKGSMTPQQVFGNWLATNLIKYHYNVNFTDLGPFRAITWNALMDIDMKDKTYGWTCEMQVKAAKKNLKSTEVAVNYRKRIGKSKVSGTLKGTILAGYKIITTIYKYK